MTTTTVTSSIDLVWPVGMVWDWTTDLRNINAISAPWLGLRYDQSYPPWLKRNFALPTQSLVLGVLVAVVELRITEWQPQTRFVDEGWRDERQVWRHTHVYTTQPRGTRYTDSIEIDVGVAGMLGRAVVALFFKHRQRNLRRLITIEG